MAAKKHSRVQELAISTGGIGGTYNEVQSVREANFNRTKTMVEATTREDGEWTSKLDGLKSGEITANCAWDESDAQLMNIVEAWENNTTIHARWRNDTGGGLRQNRAEVKVSDVSEGAPVDDMQTVDITLVISGAITQDTQ